MEYEIKFSETCLDEMDEIHEYIQYKLKNEQSANRLRAKIFDKVSGLKYYPEMYPKIGKKDRRKREYRRIVIDNYILLYSIIKEDKVILISHMFYGREKLLRRSYINFVKILKGLPS